MLTDDEKARFESKIEKTTSCWNWKGPLDRDGYGTFHLRRRGRRANRVAWFSVHGDIPKGMVVNHTCRNRSCVNPQHLNLVTASENSKRDSTSPAYINSQKTHCPKGHPYDRQYGKQRYCSVCEREKAKRLRKKWAENDDLNV